MPRKMSKKDVGKIISPVLEKLVNRLLIIKPDDPIPYMVQYLEDSKGKGAKALSKKETEELARLRTHFERYREKLGSDYDENSKVSDGDHLTSDEDDEDDYIDELP